MGIDLVFHFLREGPPTWVRDNIWLILKTAATLFALFLVKLWSNGASNTSELKMHGRVVMVTGGTSGIGAATVLDLAKRGAQVVLLTHAPVSDPFLVEYINDVREQTKNHMVYAEQVDLSSLHSIRQFATKWIDNAPPRRLDMILLCAATFTPAGQPRQVTDEGIEQTWMVNYLANFHLLGILSPALRAQPFDRDVRVVFVTCPSYIGSPPLSAPLDDKTWTTGAAYKRSKLALTTFGLAFQKHLDAYKRPDGLPMNARVLFVDPGLTRTPGMRRWLTRGTLWGLFVYLATYLLPWLLLKSPEQGAQSILHAVMEAGMRRGPGGKLIKECREVDFARKDVHDEAAAKQLWEESDKLIEKAEKDAAIVRARNKKQAEDKGKREEEVEKEKEIEELVNSIKKGKEAQKAKKAKSGAEEKPKGKKKSKKADS
ncbi:retinol dehydrogenase [Verticillium dahliae VdLs.17]|uniref:Retinol dehydrogenase n=1 Tax=Verticillium dahliae (strain VdLs.17 / ATCC MYA-4575 / FGSC 10137) TaxID=498257 RepID=G2XIY5_VERDV|nr:retinol dehydrogenase [Verticillium dahliae VdLs.17]EGY20488.1 retinol dehydrogenase [Verticillium dahliae VdLs.17]